MPSLNTAVSGLMMHQQKMDVIADNIANVNTVGFKESRAEFADSFYQTIRAASTRVPAGIAVGTGANVNTIVTVHKQGAISRTGGTFDVALSGSGFFVVRDPVKQAIYFTRAGDWSVNKEGELINSLGYNVLGVVGDANSHTDGDAIDPGLNAPTAVDKILIPNEFQSQAAEVESTGYITIGSQMPANGTNVTIGGVRFTFGTGAGFDIDTTSGDPKEVATQLQDLINTNATLSGIMQATADNDVVNLTAITATAAAGALGNNVPIGTGVATGTLTLNSNTFVNGDTLTIGGAPPFTFSTTSGEGTNILIGSTLAETAANIVTTLNRAANKANTGATAFVQTNGTILVSAAAGGVTGNTIGLATSTAQITPSGAFLTGGVAAATAAQLAFPPGSQNLLTGGSNIGSQLSETVMNVSIGLDGAVNLFGSGGTTRIIAYLMMAKFKNDSALTKVGQNLYQFNEAAGNKSGTSSFSITSDVRKAGTDGIGQIQSGALELSNVDISEQFTDMILTQRGFEANARIITTTDEMLQTIVNLKR